MAVLRNVEGEGKREREAKGEREGGMEEDGGKLKVEILLPPLSLE